MDSGETPAGLATMHLKVITAGTIIVNAKGPARGISGTGRWCDEVLLAPAFTVTAVDP